MRRKYETEEDEWWEEETARRAKGRRTAKAHTREAEQPRNRRPNRRPDRGRDAVE